MLSAIVNTIFYGKPPSIAKAFMLLPIVGGVAFASLKKGADGAPPPHRARRYARATLVRVRGRV